MREHFTLKPISKEAIPRAIQKAERYRLINQSWAAESICRDILDRRDELKENHGIGYCNITKCCTKVCPEHITITDNAIIPLKERVVDRHYDPLGKLVRLIRGRKAGSGRRDGGGGDAVSEDGR